MPDVSAGLVQITVEYSFNNTEAANVYYYWRGTNIANEPLADIANAFDALIFPEFSNCLGSSVSIDKIRVVDVFGLLPDHAKDPSVTTGAIAGELTGNFTAVSIKLFGTTKETKRGTKRIGGITESSVAGNGLTTTFRTTVETFAALLDNAMAVNAATYQPVIFGRGTIEDPDRRVVNTIASTSVPNQQTTQSSRKR